MSALILDTRTETYQDLQALIKSMARRFCQAYNMPLDEGLSLAHEAFLESFLSFQSNRGKFHSYVCQKILSKLYEWNRTTVRRNILGPRENVPMETLTEKQQQQWLVDFLDSLTEEARMVVQLVLDPPRDIIHCLIEKGDATPARWRSAIKEFLSDMGWTREQVTKTFSEIRKALQ